MIFFTKSFLYILFFIFLNLIFEKCKFASNRYDLKVILEGISEFCNILFYFIEKYLSKSIKQNNENSNTLENLIINKKYKKQFTYQSILIICCIIIFNMIYIYFNNDLKMESIFSSISFEILIVLFIDSLYFKINLEIHHYISISINSVLLIILIYANSHKKFFYIYKLILCAYLVDFSALLIQFLNTNYFINIFLLASFIGIGKACFSFINIFLIIQKKLDYNPIRIANYIIYFLNYIFYYFLFFKIILELDSIYAIVSDNVSKIIIKLIISKKKSIINILFEFIIILSSFIYLEIIELNFCNLNKNTKRNIAIRGKNMKINNYNSLSISLSHENENVNQNQ